MNNNSCSSSVSNSGSDGSSTHSATPPPEAIEVTGDAIALDEAVDSQNYSCGRYELADSSPRRGTGGGNGVMPLSTTSTSRTEGNPDFDLYKQPIENQFTWIEKEFADIEARTMNPRQYTFTTSFAFPTKNRYINVMANEETLFPPPRSSLAVRSTAQPTRSAGQRILDTLRGSPSTASEPTSSGDDTCTFKANSSTAGGKNTPLYFNGNLIDMGVEPVFIASQAPVQECMEDFLNTLYNCEIPLVLMLTELEEGGFLKADRYWPADRASGRAGEVFGNMCVYKDPADPYTVDTAHELIRRPFFVRPCNASKSREHKVIMYQYVGWPDRGVPDSTESFEELLRIINQHVAKQRAASRGIPVADSGNSSNGSHRRTSSASSSSSNGGAGRVTPSVLVHCSAGIGRTGTLIGAYAAMKAMESGRLTNESIRRIVLDMRKARFGMVQRVEQYMFLYLIVLQHLGVDTARFTARMQPRADLYNMRWMEARQKAALAARAAKQQPQ